MVLNRFLKKGTGKGRVKGKGKGKGKGFKVKGKGKGKVRKGKGKGKGKGKSKGKRRSMRFVSFPAEQRVWVGGVPEDADMKAFKEHMSQVPGCKFLSVRRNGQGGVCYSSAEEAQAAIAELNGSVFEGATIE